MKTYQHVVEKVIDGSIASELDIVPGDILVSINGESIKDVFDFRYMINDENLEILIRKKNGEEWILEIEKEYQEDLGLEFENGLMDDYRSCNNKCIFCFIDQLPKGMRETLYFKDDDSRLSFLQGNYITLTNMKDEDVDRIIRFRFEPVNISVHTTNPELRIQMLNNRFAGESLKYLEKFHKENIVMNAQIVLCKGVNDKEELEKTIFDLSKFVPCLQSLSIVPVGITKFRENLFRMDSFTKEDALVVITSVEKWQRKIKDSFGTHFVHASDEWYVLADKPLPKADTYDGYLQLENGVGMMRLFLDEIKEALENEEENLYSNTISIATGKLAAPFIKKVVQQAVVKFKNLNVQVFEIENLFFGENITVTGLLTGRDIVAQLRNQELGNRLLLSSVMFRAGEEVFLDDLSRSDVEKELETKITIVPQGGKSFVDALLERNN